jgi:hypothetical protein
MIAVAVNGAWTAPAAARTFFGGGLVPSAQTDQQHNAAPAPHELYGKITAVKDSRLTIQPRTSHAVEVDATDAVRARLSTPLIVGRAVLVRGDYDSKGVLHAQAILRAKDSAALWPADR